MVSVARPFIPKAKKSFEMMNEFEKAFGMKATLMGDAIKEIVAWFKIILSRSIKIQSPRKSESFALDTVFFDAIYISIGWR